jgi:hypothetical protein
MSLFGKKKPLVESQRDALSTERIKTIAFGLLQAFKADMGWSENDKLEGKGDLGQVSKLLIDYIAVVSTQLGVITEEMTTLKQRLDKVEGVVNDTNKVQRRDKD